MSIGLRADSGGTSGAVTINGADKLVITNSGNITATTFTGALVGNASTATKFQSTTGTAPVYGVRAWVQFSGLRNISGTVDAANTNRLIRGSGNISNVLRTGSGLYTINFSIAMSDSAYCCLANGQSTVGVSTFIVQPIVGGNAVTSVQIASVNNNDASTADIDNITVAIIR
jgi:hypothetical protein